MFVRPASLRHPDRDKCPALREGLKAGTKPKVTSPDATDG
jgi:hypothetical protein